MCVCDSVDLYLVGAVTRCNAQAGTPRVIRCAREFGFRRLAAAHGVWRVGPPTVGYPSETLRLV